MESKHLCTVGGSNVRQQGLSCKIRKAKTQNRRAWADKMGIRSLVKQVWQANKGASRPPFHTGSKAPSLESLLQGSPCYILQRHLFWFITYLLVRAIVSCLSLPISQGFQFSLSAISRTPKWRGREKLAWSVCQLLKVSPWRGWRMDVYHSDRAVSGVHHEARREESELTV